jgi:hypothetical protein
VSHLFLDHKWAVRNYKPEFEVSTEGPDEKWFEAGIFKINGNSINIELAKTYIYNRPKNSKQAGIIRFYFGLLNLLPMEYHMKEEVAENELDWETEDTGFFATPVDTDAEYTE